MISTGFRGSGEEWLQLCRIAGKVVFVASPSVREAVKRGPFWGCVCRLQLWRWLDTQSYPPVVGYLVVCAAVRCAKIAASWCVRFCVDLPLFDTLLGECDGGADKRLVQSVEPIFTQHLCKIADRSPAWTFPLVLRGEWYCFLSPNVFMRGGFSVFRAWCRRDTSTIGRLCLSVFSIPSVTP